MSSAEAKERCGLPICLATFFADSF
jgi:hypothetical protein